MLAAQRQVAQYGERSAQIVQELINSCVNNDHHRGGELVREIYDEPDKLMLVIGMLTTAVVKSTTGPLVNPEELGVDTSNTQLQPWEVGVHDQMQAAAQDNDAAAFASIAMDAQVRAHAEDFRQHRETTGHWPDVHNCMRAFLIMERTSVILMAAEGLRRLVMQEVEKEGG